MNGKSSIALEDIIPSLSVTPFARADTRSFESLALADIQLCGSPSTSKFEKPSLVRQSVLICAY